MLSLILPLILCAQASPPATLPDADRILHRGAIYTVDDAQPWAKAMAVKDGQILYVGTNAGAMAYRGTQTEMVNLRGRMVMPGMGDSHVHLLEAHHPATGTVIIESGHGLESYIPQIRAQAPNQIGTNWVLGWGFSMVDVLIDQFFFARTPRRILDDAVPNGPAIIMEETSHAMWVNSAALQAAGITRFTPDPPGGIIMKDWLGRPNGILIDTAGEVVMDLALTRSAALDNLNDVALRLGYKHAARNGITAIADARAFWKRGYVDAYKKAEQQGIMTARTVLGLWSYPYLDDTAQIAKLASMYERNPQSRLHISQIKIYSDGILNMTTGAVFDPYRHVQLGDPLGLNYFEQPRLTRYITELEQVGFDFHIHTIGDRGAFEALNAIEDSQLANPTLPERRHRLTHLELVAPTDVPRFEQLGVIADFQMSSEFVMPGNDGDLRALLGHQRVEERSLPLKDIWQTDAHLVLSSDYDVGSFSPFVGMQHALTRGAQSLPNVAAAIRAYTIEPAYLMRLETVTGSLEAGKSADYIILDRNIFRTPKTQIGQTKVIQTVFEGTEVWRAPGY
jgi:hypothetical protein